MSRSELRRKAERGERYINADVLIKLANNVGFRGNKHGKVVKAYVDACPTADVVKVVRCKDCENYRLDRPVSPAVMGDDDSFHFCCAHERYLFVSDYCSYGVRKDG